MLDADCAAGWYTDWLLNQGASVTALDFSPKMVEITKSKIGERAKIIQADLNEPLDFIEDEEFDIVLSSLTLYYLENWDRVMSEFNRILKEAEMLVF